MNKSITCCRVRFKSFDAFEIIDFDKYLARKNIQKAFFYVADMKHVDQSPIDKICILITFTLYIMR